MSTERVLIDIVRRLRKKAGIEFDKRGPLDPRGAAIWDCAGYIAEEYLPAHVVLDAAQLCEHSWVDVTEVQHADRHLICTTCRATKEEPR